MNWSGAEKQIISTLNPKRQDLKKLKKTWSDNKLYSEKLTESLKKKSEERITIMKAKKAEQVLYKDLMVSLWVELYHSQIRKIEEQWNVEMQAAKDDYTAQVNLQTDFVDKVCAPTLQIIDEQIQRLEDSINLSAVQDVVQKASSIADEVTTLCQQEVKTPPVSVLKTLVKIQGKITPTILCN